MEVLSLKQDSVVHRCLEGIKAGDHTQNSAERVLQFPWQCQVESNTDFSLFRESRVQEDVQAHADLNTFLRLIFIKVLPVRSLHARLLLCRLLLFRPGVWIRPS